MGGIVGMGYMRNAKEFCREETTWKTYAYTGGQCQHAS